VSTWKPISEDQLQGLIDETRGNLSEAKIRFFESMRIPLQKWNLELPWGHHKEGFWVIGIFGKTVLWYNDIEEGFNYSTYPKFGDIGEYWCDQHDFDHVIRRLYAFAQTGDNGVKSVPPQPIG